VADPKLDPRGEVDVWKNDYLQPWPASSAAARLPRPISGDETSLDSTLRRLLTCCVRPGAFWTKRNESSNRMTKRRPRYRPIIRQRVRVLEHSWDLLTT
jgi:hypothetical protein